MPTTCVASPTVRMRTGPNRAANVPTAGANNAAGTSCATMTAVASPTPPRR